MGVNAGMLVLQQQLIVLGIHSFCQIWFFDSTYLSLNLSGGIPLSDFTDTELVCQIDLVHPSETSVMIHSNYQNSNLVIEVVSRGIVRSQRYCANSLNCQVCCSQLARTGLAGPGKGSKISYPSLSLT